MMEENCKINTSTLPKFKYPRWIVLQLLEECNLRCKMCYEWGKEGSYKDRQELSHLKPEVIKKIISDCSFEKPYYDLFGGEPLMYPWLHEILSAIKFYGSVADMPTNGTLLEQNAEMLVDTSLNKLWVSLDGPEKINDIQRGKGVYAKAVKGIKKVYELRESKGRKFPRIGVSFIITPLNYRFIEDFFFKQIDLSLLDQLSIEVQLFASEEQCAEYERVLKDEFGIHGADCARGMIWDTGEFASIDIVELTRQLNSVAEYCNNNGISFLTYPKTLQEDNLKNYFSGNFSDMTDKKSRCGLPWIYAEINAKGNVSPCHAFYDLTFGNVNNQSLLEIWSSAEYKNYRNYMKRNLLPICTACSRYFAHNSKGDGLF